MHTHFQFLIEDSSGRILIDAIMRKLKDKYTSITYDSKSFRGIGGFTKKNTVKETRTGKLLNDLATYLRGFNKSLYKSKDFNPVIVVVVDNDDRNTKSFRAELNQIAVNNNISIDHVFCIAVEEMEAWLLGDEQALLSAYPTAKRQVLSTYVQDSICGTWELLADVVYPGGRQKMKKEYQSYVDIGKIKCEWAQEIGLNMNLESNSSPSFNYFIGEINKRVCLA